MKASKMKSSIETKLCDRELRCNFCFSAESITHMIPCYSGASSVFRILSEGQSFPGDFSRKVYVFEISARDDSLKDRHLGGSGSKVEYAEESMSDMGKRTVKTVRGTNPSFANTATIEKYHHHARRVSSSVSLLRWVS